MPTLFGRSWTRDELRKHTGQMNQIAGCTRFELQEGIERGVEICELKTGSGLRVWVCPSRCMDIVYAEHNGRPLCWNSSTGIVHPAFYSEENYGWLRGFHGGLVTTCGLSSFSVRCVDEGEVYGMHDRVSYLPASGVRTEAAWKDEEFEMSVEGTIRQTRVFGPNLTLRRRVSAHLGDDFVTIHDRIENEGFEPAPAVILYHCNFGFPVVAQGSIVRAPSQEVVGRDKWAQAELDQWTQMEAAQPGNAERCYAHTMTPDEAGWVQAEIWNPALNFGGFVRYRHDELPFFTQWKMMGAGTYACGLEPSNAYLVSRAELRKRGELPILQPGEVKEIRVELGALKE